MFLSVLLLGQLSYNWDQLDAVQILESDHEIRIFYEVQHYQKLVTRPWWGKPVEQGLLIYTPGREPQRRRLVPIRETLTSPEDYAPLPPEEIAKIHRDELLSFHPVRSHVFVLDGSIYLRTNPSFGQRLMFYELREDRFATVAEETEHKIRDALGIGPGPKVDASDEQLDKLSKRSGWHMVVSDAVEFWPFHEPNKATSHPVTFIVENREVYPERKHPLGRAAVFKVMVEQDGEQHEEVLLSVKTNGRKGVR